MVVDAIPEEIKGIGQWVCWRYEFRKGRWTKPPVNAHTGEYASSTDPNTWSTFAAAVARYRADGLDGIGFVVTGDDDYTGADFDDCIDPDTGTVDPVVADCVRRLNSYTEVSPSGQGLRVILRGCLPVGARNRYDDVEVYSHARYLTLTGQHVDGAPTTIEDRQESLLAVHHETIGQFTDADRSDQSNGRLSDDEVIERASAARNGERFRCLWAGDRSG